MKDEFSLHCVGDGWKVINESPLIYYKTRFSERFQVEIPHSEGDLISWYRVQVGAEIIPSISMFLNGQRLSTQVPMHHKYYTDTLEMENINGALQHATIVYTEQFYDIKTLQRAVKGEYHE